MRFLEGGADIPDELIRAVTAGDVVFLCGAGISVRAGLPMFKELTEQVYAALGESSDNEPAERIAFDRYEYDRVLRSLEKRTLGAGASRVRIAVTKLLAAPDVALPDHLALLQLSRDPGGRPRLLTTNFDTLFERAAMGAGLTVRSHATRAMPNPGHSNDHGVLHLHGRIGDPKLNLDESELILTSADFGHAYLRDGWASQYVEDRMRLSTLVLVGYRAEDAALRLLLETLDADRARFRDLKDIYAIEKQAADSASIWKAKGIKPIEFASYADIYATLAEWAQYAQNPREYTLKRVRTILTSTAATGT
jgi:hypothetical protein